MNSADQNDATDVKCCAKYGVLTKKEVFRWNVQSSLILNRETGVRSDFFTFGPAKNSKFCLLLATDPNKAEYYGSQFGVCLCKVPANSVSDIAIKVSFSLLDIRERQHHACERTMKECDKVYATFDRGILDKHQLMFLCKGTLTIYCAMDVEEVLSDDSSMENSVVHKTLLSPKPSSEEEALCGTKDLVDDLRTVLENGKFSDISVNVEGKEFHVHRVILGARSPVLAAMFEHDTLENSQSRIVIEDIPSDVIPQLLRYLYTGETDQLSPQTALPLFVAADKYSLPKLKSKCSSYLCTSLTAEVALNVLIVANMHEDDNLKEAAVQIVLDNAVQVMKSDDWLTFMKDYCQLANSVILRLAMKK